MTRRERRVALIGFGEAGRIIGAGLAASKRFDVVAYDLLLDDPCTREGMCAAASERGVLACGSTAEAVDAARIVISAVTAASSVDVARAAAPKLGPGCIFVDINSVSPKTKQRSAEIVEGAGAAYVDAAVMAPVPPYGIKVPILLGGEAAGELAALLGPAGMQLEVVAARVGEASAIKMCRSVMVKGLEALVLECLLAARGYGVEDRVLASLEETFPEMNWDARADYLISRIVVHGRRRAAEMREVAATLREAGVEPRITLATAQAEDWIADLAAGGTIGFSTMDEFAWRRMADAIFAANAVPE
jgi:3-hydroxyisobutyrate dehydrogenase-like beta-hydroxyacid dehydrogenase